MAGQLIVVGSSDLWVTPQISAMVIAKIISTAEEWTVGVRVPRGSDEPTTPLERFAFLLGPLVNRTVCGNRAQTNTKGDVWRRDYEMIEQAVEVMAFFAPDREMRGGTGHVVQAALNRGIPVEAYRLGETGYPELLGSDDGTIQGDPFDSTFSAPQGGFTLHTARSGPIHYNGGSPSAAFPYSLGDISNWRKRQP